MQAARKGSRGAARVELNKRGGKPTEEAVQQQLQRGRGRTQTKGRRGAASRATGGALLGDGAGVGLSVEGPQAGAFVGASSPRQGRAGSAAALKKRGGGRQRRRKNLPSEKH